MAPNLTTKTENKSDAAASAKALAESLKQIENRSTLAKQVVTPVPENATVEQQQQKELEAKETQLQNERIADKRAVSEEQK